MAKNRNFHDVILHSYPQLILGTRSLSTSDQIPSRDPSTILSPTTLENSSNQKNKKHRHTIQIGESETDVADKWLRNHHQRHHKHVMDILKDLRIHRHSLTYRGAMLNINKYRLRASSCPDIYRNSMTTIASDSVSTVHQIYSEFKKLILDILDFSYFLDIRFLLFAISNFILYTWYDVVYVYLPDWAIEHKVSETDASMLISLIGIVNMFGEIVLGWCGDREQLSPSVVYAICMGLCGVSVILIPLFFTYTWMCVLSSAFGLFIAANYSLTSIILVNLVDLDRFTNAYGLLLLVQGIANLVGPPLAGMAYDVTGNYDLSFYLAGGFIFISGVLLLILPLLNSYRKYQRRRESKCDATTVNEVSL
jgi:Major Facilitator Superfamily